MPAILGAAGTGMIIGQTGGAMLDDAIVSGGKVIPINSDDDIIAHKQGGPLRESGALLGGGGGATEQVVTINIPDLGIENIKIRLNEANQRDREITMAAGVA